MRRVIGGTVVYDREGPAGWAVAVMPDNVLIDSYHGHPHVHTHAGDAARDRKLPIALTDRASVLRAVEAHLERHGRVRRRELWDDLGATPGSR